MNHSFDVDIARQHGVDAAIIIENLRFWIAKNKANKRHFYDGRFWTYNSSKAMAELFPYWSAKQIERIISKLKASGVLIVGHYSQNAYDRTNWYSLEGIEAPEKEKPFPEIGKSTRTDINTKGKTPAKPDDVDEQTWADWLTLRRAKGAPATETVLSGARREAEKAGMPLVEFLAIWCLRGSQGLKAEWLNAGERHQSSGRQNPFAGAI